jgi:hypothetical protein
MRTVRLSSDDWSHEPIMAARGFLERLLGLRMLEPGSALLLERSSVHAIGMTQAFRAVGLSDDYVVMNVKTVRPWAAVRFRGCRYVLELPLDLVPPAIGTRLEVSRV